MCWIYSPSIDIEWNKCDQAKNKCRIYFLISSQAENIPSWHWNTDSHNKKRCKSLTSNAKSYLKSFIFCQVELQVVETETRVIPSPSPVTQPHISIQQCFHTREHTRRFVFFGLGAFYYKMLQNYVKMSIGALRRN